MEGFKTLLFTINRNPHLSKLQKEYIVETARNMIYRDKEGIKERIKRFNELYDKPKEKKVVMKEEKRKVREYKGDDGDDVIVEEEEKRVQKPKTNRRRR